MCFKSLDVVQEKRQFGCQLGLDTDTMNALKLEYDDLAEVKYLTKYLDLDASLSSIFTEKVKLDIGLPKASALIVRCFKIGLDKDSAIKQFIEILAAD